MNQSTQQLRSRATVRLGSMAVATMAAVGLSGSLAVVDTAGAASGVVVSTSKTAKYGTILVSGTTLYTLQKASKTACGANCLKVWPPLLLSQGVTAATAGPGVNAAKLGTVATSSGALQVTYSGKALYWFKDDKHAGQVKGNITDKWGKWADVATVKPAHSSSSSSGGSSAGSGGASF